MAIAVTLFLAVAGLTVLHSNEFAYAEDIPVTKEGHPCNGRKIIISQHIDSRI